jgi:DNA-binding beta-propeller fold protein YncE
MSLRLVSTIELPASLKKGGFDHAAVLGRTLYVAHTANDALDLIDTGSDRFLRSIAALTGIAGALVSPERSLVFTSNRGENTVGIFAPDREHAVEKITVGVRPNGLAFDPERQILLAANVGDPAIAGSHTASVVDVARRELRASIPVPGRTRWTIFDAATGSFYVNIADPPQIVVIDAGSPTKIARSFPIPAAGPHGLDLDPATRRLFCACDAKTLVTLDADSGRVLNELALSGVPDVIFFNAARRRLYVTVGDPGVIDVIDTDRMTTFERVETGRGAHTIGFDAARNKVYAFLPAGDRALVFEDTK